MKYLFFIVTIFLTFIAFHINVLALDIRDISSLNIDTSGVKIEEGFSLPEKVIIVPIYKNESTGKLSDEAWIKGVFHYSITKLGFSDIPFHYLVTGNGKIFKGNAGGDERKINITGLGDDSILVGYIADQFDTQIDPRAFTNLQDLLIDICNRNGVDPESIQVRGVKFIRDKATLSVSISEDTLYGSWNSSIAGVKANVKAGYKPQSRSYSIQIAEVVPPAGGAKPGSTIKVGLKIKNTGQVGIYGGGRGDLIAGKVDAGKSAFFLNNVWVSTSQFSILDDGEALQPGAEKTFEVEMKAPLSVGTISENFAIKTLDGALINANVFTVSISLGAADLPIVEVGATETGNLNVRASASSAAEIVSQVSAGERFFQTNDAGNGWVEIQLDDGTKGWVAGWYLRRIN